jgi:hypothetical protein
LWSVHSLNICTFFFRPAPLILTTYQLDPKSRVVTVSEGPVIYQEIDNAISVRNGR